MEREVLSVIAHRRHPIACPFSDGKVAALLDELDGQAGASVLDIGCGQGEWLLQLLPRIPHMRGIGIDQSTHRLDLARSRTAALSSRLQFHLADAAEYVAACSEKFDVVICAGSTQALGGYEETLSVARRLLNEHGRLLIADGFWEKPPAQAALAVLGIEEDSFGTLDGMIDKAVGAGYTPLYAAVSNQDEWDHYEWSWCGSLERYAAENPSDQSTRQILEAARSHRNGYLTGYRGILGFVALVLIRATGLADAEGSEEGSDVGHV